MKTTVRSHKRRTKYGNTIVRSHKRNIKKSFPQKNVEVNYKESGFVSEFVVKDNGSNKGNALFFRLKDESGNPVMYFQSIYITSGERGKGYGSILLKEVANYADKHKMDIEGKVVGEVDKNLAIYKRYGFKIVEERMDENNIREIIIKRKFQK